MRAAKPYRDHLLKNLKKPRAAELYLNAVLAEKDEATFLIALRDVVDAHGVSAVARMSKIHRTHIYRMLSKIGNPTLQKVDTLLDSVGLRLQVACVR